jgi:hypothetical protein
VDLLLVITAFAAWEELVTSRSRSPAAATAAIIDLAIRAVLGAGDGRATAPGSSA